MELSWICEINFCLGDSRWSCSVCCCDILVVCPSDGFVSIITLVGMWNRVVDMSLSLSMCIDLSRDRFSSNLWKPLVRILEFTLEAHQHNSHICVLLFFFQNFSTSCKPKRKPFWNSILLSVYMCTRSSYTDHLQTCGGCCWAWFSGIPLKHPHNDCIVASASRTSLFLANPRQKKERKTFWNSLCCQSICTRSSCLIGDQNLSMLSLYQNKLQAWLSRCIMNWVGEEGVDRCLLVWDCVVDLRNGSLWSFHQQCGYWYRSLWWSRPSEYIPLWVVSS